MADICVHGARAIFVSQDYLSEVKQHITRIVVVVRDGSVEDMTVFSDHRLDIQQTDDPRSAAAAEQTAAYIDSREFALRKALEELANNVTEYVEKVAQEAGQFPERACPGLIAPINAARQVLAR